jgi:glycosyltransferase
MAAHPTLYVRRDWYLRIGGFDSSFSIAADYHSIIKLFLHADFKAVYIPDVLVVMRSGGASNKSFEAIIRKSKEDWLALRGCGFSHSQALIAIVCKNVRKIPQLSSWLKKTSTL